MHISMRRRQMFLRHEPTVKWRMSSRRIRNRSRNIWRRYCNEKQRKKPINKIVYQIKQIVNVDVGWIKFPFIDQQLKASDGPLNSWQFDRTKNIIKINENSLCKEPGHRSMAKQEAEKQNKNIKNSITSSASVFRFWNSPHSRVKLHNTAFPLKINPPIKLFSANVSVSIYFDNQASSTISWVLSTRWFCLFLWFSVLLLFFWGEERSGCRLSATKGRPSNDDERKEGKICGKKL